MDSGGLMQDKFEIEVHGDGVQVWATNWKGGSGLAADIRTDMTRKEIAQELYDLLAMSGREVKFKEG
jgi:hypothetical protein